MRKSAAVSADLQEKKEADDADNANDALRHRNHASSSGTKTLNLGLQTGTSRGDSDRTAVGKNVKRPRKETDKRYNDSKKSKLKHYPEVCNELAKKTQECEYLKEKVKSMNQLLQIYVKRDGERDSQVSLMLSDRACEKQQIQNLYCIIERLMIQQQPGSMMIQQQPGPGGMMIQQPGGVMIQQQPGEMIQQQPGGMTIQQHGGMIQRQPGEMIQQQPEDMMIQQHGGMIQQQPKTQQDGDNVDEYFNLSDWRTGEN